MNKNIFAVRSRWSRRKRKKIKIWSHSNGSNFEAHWTTINKDLSKLEKFTLVPGLSMNFFLEFNDTKLARKLVWMVNCFQASPQGYSISSSYFSLSETNDLLDELWVEYVQKRYFGWPQYSTKSIEIWKSSMLKLDSSLQHVIIHIMFFWQTNTNLWLSA